MQYFRSLEAYVDRNTENQVCWNALTDGTGFCNYCMPQCFEKLFLYIDIIKHFKLLYIIKKYFIFDKEAFLMICMLFFKICLLVNDVDN